MFAAVSIALCLGNAALGSFAVASSVFASYHGALLHLRIKRRASAGLPVQKPVTWMLVIGSLLLGGLASLGAMIAFVAVCVPTTIFSSSIAGSRSSQSWLLYTLIFGGSALIALALTGFFLRFFLPRKPPT